MKLGSRIRSLARIGNDNDLGVIENSGKGEHAGRETGNTKIDAIAGDRPEVETAISQGGLACAHSRDILNGLIEGRIRFKPRPAPERFPDGRIAAPAMEALFCAVIDAGYARQRLQ